MSKKKPAYIDGKFVGDTLSISMKPHYQKEYEFLKSHHNRSGLICELIRQYLEGGEMTLGFQKPAQSNQPIQPIQKEEVKAEEIEKKEEVKVEAAPEVAPEVKVEAAPEIAEEAKPVKKARKTTKKVEEAPAEDKE